jgi:hypothetical protein
MFAALFQSETRSYPTIFAALYAADKPIVEGGVWGTEVSVRGERHCVWQ